MTNKTYSSGTIFRSWLSVGLQSFGGGGASLILIHRTAVEQQRWICEAEFIRYWALVQIAPGINLLALTILIGRRIGGARGIALALLGLLLPSASITILLTALYARFQDLPVMRAALRGVIPATVGLGALTALQMARSLLADSRKEGMVSLAVSIVLLIGSGLAAAVWHRPVFLVLVVSGVFGALTYSRLRRSAEPEKEAGA